MKNILICLVMAGLSAGSAEAVVLMRCDVGGCGPLQAGGTSLSACGSYYDVAGTAIDVTLATGNPSACECRNPGGSGPLANVEADFLFADNETASPGSDFILTLSDLIPGVSYRLLSFHNRSDEADTIIGAVTVTGAAVISAPGSIVQNHNIMDNPAEFIFIATGSEVALRYQGPDGGCAGCQAFFNGFILEYGSAVMGFDCEASGNPESVSPAILNVVVSQ